MLFIHDAHRERPVLPEVASVANVGIACVVAMRGIRTMINDPNIFFQSASSTLKSRRVIQRQQYLLPSPLPLSVYIQISSLPSEQIPARHTDHGSAGFVLSRTEIPG